MQVDKAQATMVVTVAVATFVAIFSLVSAKVLLKQRSYQARVISQQAAAETQLEKDIQSSKDLITSYKAFVGTSDNVLHGNPTGSGPQDGDNAKIILDALPSKYDFPALATSIEKILTARNLDINGITGTDDEVVQSGNNGSGDPQPVDMPFEFEVTGSYASMQQLIGDLQNSIRPFDIQKLEFQGSNDKMKLTLNAQTYYQPEKDLSIKEQTVQ